MSAIIAVIKTQVYTDIMKSVISRGNSFIVSVLIGSAVIVGTGCQIVGNDNPTMSEMALMKRTWTLSNSGSYTFRFQRGCFCIHGGSFDIRVLDNVIVEVSSLLNEENNVPPEDYQYFWTIDELFDLIQEAQSGKADEIAVEYSEEGYPTSIDIDYIKKAIDDELFLKVENMQME